LEDGGIVEIYLLHATHSHHAWVFIGAIFIKLSQLILRKIIKIVATRYQILRLKCNKLYFGWGSAPDSVGGAYSTPPGLLAGFKAPTS